MKSYSDIFSIDDVGMVSLVQCGNKDGVRKEKENGIASVMQSMSGDTDGVEANETNLSMMAEAALKINELSNPSTDSPSSVSTSKQKPKK